MVDVFAPKERSRIMAAVRSKDTKPELAIRSALHRLGYRYRLHAKNIPGKPDLFFTGRRKAVLINGCFWHGHAGCRRAKLPTTNTEFWTTKISKNVARDRANRKRLRELGIDAFVVWQCELKDTPLVVKRITKFLGARRLAKKT